MITESTGAAGYGRTAKKYVMKSGRKYLAEDIEGSAWKKVSDSSESLKSFAVSVGDRKFVTRAHSAADAARMVSRCLMDADFKFEISYRIINLQNGKTATQKTFVKASSEDQALNLAKSEPNKEQAVKYYFNQNYYKLYQNGFTEADFQAIPIYALGVITDDLVRQIEDVVSGVVRSSKYLRAANVRKSTSAATVSVGYSSDIDKDDAIRKAVYEEMGKVESALRRAFPVVLNGQYLGNFQVKLS